jgi:hypothetical protein
MELLTELGQYSQQLILISTQLTNGSIKLECLSVASLHSSVKSNTLAYCANLQRKESVAYMSLCSKGRLLALPANIRLEWK